MEDCRSPFVATASLVHRFFNGAITAWSGLLSNIPRGWVVCDGNNGTPDLRSSFIRGAADGIEAGSSGGNTTHQHDATGDGHQHYLTGSGVIDDVGPVNSLSTEENITFTSELASNLPTYYDLIYIMEWEDW